MGGSVLGARVGALVGDLVGSRVGRLVLGALVGDLVGSGVGEGPLSGFGLKAIRERFRFPSLASLSTWFAALHFDNVNSTHTRNNFLNIVLTIEHVSLHFAMCCTSENTVNKPGNLFRAFFKNLKCIKIAKT